MTDYLKDLRNRVGNIPLIICGSAVIIYNDENEILLQKRMDNNFWGLIGGSMELGETFEETAYREAKEEIGVLLGKLTFLNIYSGQDLFYKYPNGDKVYNVVTAYSTNDFSGKLKVDGTESCKISFFNSNKLPSNINKPDLPIIKNYFECK